MAACTSTDGNTRQAQHLTSLGIFLVRVVLGSIFIYYAGQHAFGWFGGRGIGAFANTLSHDHFPVLPPLVWAWMSAIAELVGSSLIILGLLSRLAAVLMILDMFGVLWAHWAEGFGGTDFNIALIAMAGLVLIAGPGQISIDYLICSKGCKRQPAAPTGSTGAATA